MTDRWFIPPSAAKRWFACPGSAQLSARIPKHERPAPNEYALRGRMHHQMLAAALLGTGGAPRQRIGETIIAEDSTVPVAERSFVVSAEDAAHVDLAYQFVLERRKTYSGPVAYTEYVEHRVDAGENFHSRDPDLGITVPTPLADRCRGDVDVGFLAPGYLEVIDYKSGRYPVDADDPQLKLYALGLMKEAERKLGIRTIRLTVVQPRREDGQTVNTAEITPEELMEFAVEVGDAARACAQPEAPLHAGDHCKFCPAKAICPELAQESVSAFSALEPPAPAPTNPAPGPTVDDDLAPLVTRAPETLTPEQIARILGAREMVRGWLNAVEEYANAQVAAGVTIPGFCLGRGRRERYWTVEEEALLKRLRNMHRLNGAGERAGKLKKDDYTVTKILSPAQAEKRIKPLVTAKAWENLSKLIGRTEGKPVLVSVDDPRAETPLIPSTQAFAEVDAQPPALPDFMR